MSTQIGLILVRLRQFVTSRRAKKVYLSLAAILILFFLLNNLLLPWYVNAGGMVVVPAVIGKKYENARQILDSLGLRSEQPDTMMDNIHPRGVVILQNPAEGGIVKRGRRVYLTISGGEVLVSVPNIKGRTLRDAKFGLEREGLRLGAIEYQSSDQFPQNTVIEQRVAQGSKIRRDQYVSIVLSQGPTTDKVTVPDLNRKNLTEAEKILQSLGLRVGNMTYVPSPELLPNTVVQQFPLAGELVAVGQAVDLFVVQAIEKKKELFEN